MSMTYSRQMQAYRANQVMTADPGTILLMLYQGAIDFLCRAQEAMERKEMAEKGLYINKTLAIVSELLSSLNLEVGGEVAQNLEALYLFMISHITTANVKNDPRCLAEMIQMLSTLKTGWEGAIASERKRTASEVPQTVPLAAQSPLLTSHESTLAARA